MDSAERGQEGNITEETVLVISHNPPVQSNNAFEAHSEKENQF